MEAFFELSVEDRRRQLLLALGRPNLQSLCESYSLDVSDRRKPDAYVDALIRADIPMFQALSILSRDHLKHICRQIGVSDVGTEKVVLAKRISRSIATRSLQHAESGARDDDDDYTSNDTPDVKAANSIEAFFELSVEDRRRQLLLALGRPNLQSLCESYSLDVSDRRKPDAYVDALIRADIPMFQALSILSRDHLKHICQQIGVSDVGTEKVVLAKRISRSIATRSLQHVECDAEEEEGEEGEAETLVQHSEPKHTKQVHRTVQAKPAPLIQRRTKVFVSYSHKDREWLDRLHVHLRPLHRQGSIDLWDDTKISAGMTWREEIQCAIEAARVAILLISARFLDSEFIDNNELPPLLDAAKRDGLTIIPLIVSPCRFSRTAIGRYQAINSPDETLMELDEAKRERIFVKLVSRIEDLLQS